jgi:hypothetical protein
MTAHHFLNLAAKVYLPIPSFVPYSHWHLISKRSDLPSLSLSSSSQDKAQGLAELLYSPFLKIHLTNFVYASYHPPGITEIWQEFIHHRTP